MNEKKLLKNDSQRFEKPIKGKKSPHLLQKLGNRK